MNITVLDNVCIAPNVHLLRLAPETPLTWLPGQWVSLHLPVEPHPPLVRAYSLASPMEEAGSLELVFDLVDGGLGSEYLAGLKPGATLETAGIFGKFVLPEPLPPTIVCAARHTGIVPVRCMVRHLASVPRPPRVTVVHGACRADALLWRDEFAALAKSEGWFSYHPTVVDDASSNDELGVLKGLPETQPPCVPMVCGVRAFTQPVREWFTTERGYERREVKVENYD